MDSNVERAEHGDLIEITNSRRVDYGKRMQVATAGESVVTALDNRVRVTIEHGDYAIVRRCGRPATADAVGAAPKVKVVGGGLRAGKSAAAEAMPQAVVVPRAPVTPKLTEDEAVARLEAAVYDVPVTRRVALAVDESKVTVKPADDICLEAALPTPARVCAEHKTEQYARNEQAQALAARAEGINIDAPHTPAKASAEDRAKLAEAEKAEPGTLETALQAPHSDMVDAVRYALGAQRIYQDGLQYSGEPVSIEQIVGDYPSVMKLDARKHSHYFKTVPCKQIDVYRVLAAFDVADPCIQHALKKLLVAGARGTKNLERDVQEAIDSLTRWQEMRREEEAA